jgi:hypothetical protein
MVVVVQLEEDGAEKKKIEGHLKNLTRTLTFLYKIKSLDEEDEEKDEESYNIGVYRVLPYPPNTKDAKDFFVQRN